MARRTQLQKLQLRSTPAAAEAPPCRCRGFPGKSNTGARGLRRRAALPQPHRNRTNHRTLSSQISPIFLGANLTRVPKITDGQLPVPVWTSQTSGYYYCANDPYALSMQPAESMTQGEALLKGYRPRAGQFCN